MKLVTKKCFFIILSTMILSYISTFAVDWPVGIYFYFKTPQGSSLQEVQNFCKNINCGQLFSTGYYFSEAGSAVKPETIGVAHIQHEVFKYYNSPFTVTSLYVVWCFNAKKELIKTIIKKEIDGP